MELDYFPPSQYLLLMAGFISIFFGLFYYEYSKKINTALFFVLAGAFLLRLFSALLDPFLNMWDEQFHALVAKNMMEHPFKPMLISKPWLPYYYTGWTSNHIWLHKQPLFLWQMALSMKMFGVNEFALRLPSLVMMVIAAFFTFRIGKLLLGNREGLFAAALFSTLNYSHQLSSGFEHTDHNDVAFLFYVTASMWAWVEYAHCSEKKKIMKWALLTGLFAGMAVLNKWLTGLLVFSGWFFYIVFDKEHRLNTEKYKHLLLGFIVSVIVFLPWQIYISIMFPAESAYESNLNSQHFFEAVEGHPGGTWYHIEILPLLYGYIAPYIIIPGLIFFYSRSKKKRLAVILILNIILLYIFFTLAATKMHAFTFPVAPFIVIAFAALAYQAFDFISERSGNFFLFRVALLLILIISCFFNMDVPHLEAVHGNNKRNKMKNFYVVHRTKTRNFYVSLRERLVGKEFVIFNLPQNEAVFAMFYLPFTCYDNLPEQHTINDLKKRGLTVAVVKTGPLPAYIEDDAECIKLLPLENDMLKQTKVQLKAANNKYLCVDQWIEGKLFANRDLPGEWETFNLIQFRDSSYGIQSFTGRYLSTRINDGHKVEANNENVQEWEHFTIQWLGKNEIGIKSCNDKFLRVQQDGSLIADKDSLLKECRFTLSVAEK